MLDRRWVYLLLLIAGCRTKDVPRPASAAPPAPRIAKIATIAALSTGLRATESARIAVATADGRPVAFLADEDDHAIVTLDALTLAPLARVDVGSVPHDVLVLESGAVLTTLPEVNEVAVLASAGANGELRVERRIQTATEPLAIAASPDGSKIAVTAGAGHRVDVLDGRTLDARASYDVAREPRAALFSKEGVLFVSHAAQGRISTLSFAAGSEAASDGEGIELGIRTPTGDGVDRIDPTRAARQANALVRLASADGERIVVPLVQNAPKGGAPPGGGYGGGGGGGEFEMFPMVMPPPPGAPPDPFAMPIFKPRGAKPRPPSGPPNKMSAFDVRTIDVARASLSTFPDRSERRTPALLRECLLPSAAVAVSDSRILVACFGESEVLRLDATAGVPKIVGKLAVGRGPSAIARVDASRALVWSALARTTTLVATADDGDPPAIVTRELPRTIPVEELVLRGRELFHRNGDPRISEDGLACASCHPGGRDDGLVWASPRGDRRTRTLAGNAGRPSTFGWGGEHATIATHVKETVKRLRGKGLPDEDLEAVFAYIRTMRPVPAAGSASDPEAHRGAQVFASDRAACATCHDPSGGFTDHERHEIGWQRMVTPSLLGVGARGTLFHDGRYKSLEAMLHGEDAMGGITRLSEDEKRDLAAFLRTL